MNIKPQHLHLSVGVLALVSGAGVLMMGYPLPSIFLFCGGVVALIHWKFSKMGLIDR